MPLWKSEKVKDTHIGNFLWKSDNLRGDLDIPLNTSLVPHLGKSIATFTRTTAGTVLDFEGILHTALINEIRFPGARRVRNLLSNTEVLSTQTITVLTGSSYILSFSGTGSVTLSGAATGTLSGSTGRVQITKTATTSSLTLTVAGSVLQAQLEKVTGTQTVASEYVSSGVLSWPYHGAGVDGVKYFLTDREGNAINPSGALIEPSSTNLFLNSSSPATQSITVVNGSSYTVWGTGNGSVVLSGAGSGTVTSASQRTFTATSTTLTCTVTNMSTVQVELGVKTSYIPTSGTAVTRTADILSYDVEDVITQGQGSLYCEFYLTLYAGQKLFSLFKDSQNRIFCYVSSSSTMVLVVKTSNVDVAVISISSITSGLNKLLITYEDNSLKCYLNGELKGSDTSCSMPVDVTTLSVGAGYNNTNQVNGTVKNVMYFKEVLPQSEAIRRTT